MDHHQTQENQDILECQAGADTQACLDGAEPKAPRGWDIVAGVDNPVGLDRGNQVILAPRAVRVLQVRPVRRVSQDTLELQAGVAEWGVAGIAVNLESQDGAG